MDLITKSSNKVTVGDKYSDLMLRTLGRVYIQTGSKSELLDDLIKRIIKATESESKAASSVITVDDDEALTSLTYPGDNQFVFVTSSKNLYITAGGEYIPIVAVNDQVIDWSNVKGNYVKLSGDKMTGDLQAPNLTATKQLISKTYTEPPLVVKSDLMVKNLNSEYLNGKRYDELAVKNDDEQIGGAWTFTNIETFKQRTNFEGNIGTPYFTSGFFGVGWQLESATNTLTVDNLVVRRTMNVYELVVNKIKATNGALWVTDSAKIVEATKVYATDGSITIDLDDGTIRASVPEDFEHNTPDDPYDTILDKTAHYVLADTYEKVYIYAKYFTGDIYRVTLDEDYVPFRINDILRCQQFDGSNINYYDAVVINTSNEDIHMRLYRLVSVGDDGEEWDLTSTPAEDQPLVRIGNISDEDRQGAIYLTSSDDNSPYIDIIDGLNRPDFSTSIKCAKLDEIENKMVNYNNRPMTMRIGKLDGIYDSAFGLDQPKGMGLYGENVYIKGRIVQVQEGKEYITPIYRGAFLLGETYYYYNYVLHNNAYYIMVDQDDYKISGVYPDYVDPDFEATENQTNKYWQVYLKAVDAVANITSYVFKRSESKPDAPVGGSFISPEPVSWSDGVPEGDKPLWMSYKVFYSDNRETPDWSDPVPMSNTSELQIKYSEVASSPGTPDTHPQYWQDEATEDVVFMAMRSFVNQAWGDWEVSKIKGEAGESGDDGYTVLISNEVHTVPTDKSGYPLEDSTTTHEVSVYKGGKLLSPTLSIIEQQAGVVATVKDSVVTLTYSKAAKLESCEVPIRIIIDDLEIRRVISICAVTNGSDASYVVLSGDQVFSYAKNGTTLSDTPNPTSITITATPVNCTIKDWLIKPASKSYTSQDVTDSTFTVSPTADYWQSQRVITVKVLAVDNEGNERYDEMSIAKIEDGTNGTDGESAYSVVLTNEVHSILVDADGYPEENETMTCQVLAYRGATKVTPGSITLSNVPSGVSYTINNDIITFSFITNRQVTAAQIGVSVRITTSVTIDKVISLVTVKNGEDGEDGKNAGLVSLSGDQVFLYKKKGTAISSTPDPTSITLTANAINSTISNWYVKGNSGSYIAQDTTSKTFTVTPDASYWGSARLVTIKVTAKDLAGNEVYDEMSIVKLYDGVDGDVENGVEGAVLRVTEWAVGFSYNDGTINENGTRYKDIATIVNGPKEFYAFECLKEHESTEDNKPVIGYTTEYWSPLNQMSPIYTSLIFAENARFYMAASNEIAVLDSDDNVIAALSGSNSTHTMWSGGATPDESNFSVTKGGKLTAMEAQITGEFTVKAKNDERSIALKVDEYTSRSSGDTEDPTIKLTDKEGTVVTELNGNEYTDPGSELSDETGSLSLIKPGTDGDGKLLLTDTVTTRNNTYYRESGGDVDLTSYIDHSKNLKVSISGLTLNVNAQPWLYNPGANWQTTTFTDAGDMCYIRISASIWVGNTQIASLAYGYECSTSSQNGQIVYSDTSTISSTAVFSGSTSVSSDVFVKGTGSHRVSLKYYIQAYSNKQSIVEKVGKMGDSETGVWLTNMDSFVCNYEISGYASKYFANGLILGTKNSNSVQLYNSSDKMTAKLMSDGSGLVVDSTGVKYNRVNGTSTYKLPMMSCVYTGIVNLASSGTIPLFGQYYSYTARSSNQSTLDLKLLSTNSGVSFYDLVFMISGSGAYAQTGYSVGSTGTVILYSSIDKINLTIYMVT